MTLRWLVSPSVAAGILLLMPGPRPAQGCLNGIERLTERPVELLVWIEGQMRQGRPLHALGKLQDGPIPILEPEGGPKKGGLSPFGLAEFPTARGSTEVPGIRLRQKWQFLYVLASLRTANETPYHAARFFRALVARDPNNVMYLAALGEAESLWHESTAHALEVLGDLEARGLLPGADSALALARVRHERKDLAGRDRALELCRRLGGSARRCSLAPRVIASAHSRAPGPS